MGLLLVPILYVFTIVKETRAKGKKKKNHKIIAR